MGALVLTGDTSGSVTVAVPLVAGSNTVTIPAVTGTAVIAGQNSAITSGTAIASTSGTSIDFTSIPSWVKRVTVMFKEVSTNGTSLIQVQIGSGSVTTSGYFGSSYYHNTSGISASGYGSGLVVCQNIASGSSYSGLATLCLISASTWVGNGAIENNAGLGGGGSTSIALGGTLDRVRITTVNGTDTFDAGSINILYE